MLRAHQQIHRPAQACSALHQSEDVALAVADLHQPGLGQVTRSLGQALVAFDPTRAFAQSATLATGVARLARPHPRIENAQRLAIRADCVGRVQIHAALGLVAQRAQALDGLAVEVQLGGVMQAQHHRQPAHALHDAPTVRLDDLAPIATLVVEQAVSRRRVAPAAARRRNARRRLGCQLLDQLDQAAVEPLVSKLHCRKLFRRPRHHSIRCQIIDLRRIDEVVCNGMGSRCHG